MSRGHNAQIAVDMYRQLHATHNWTPVDAWKGIATLLLSCEIYRDGWKPFHGVVVFRESNDFKIGKTGPNATLQKAARLTSFLEQSLGLPAGTCCASIGTYWRQPLVATLQPHNLVGHAFRSIVVEILATHGSTAISYKEEVDPKDLFIGVPLHLRSENPKLDIVAYKGNQPVAIISCRWRYRHDRVDVDQESIAYKNAARIAGFPNMKFYAMLGEFSAARLDKVLSNSVGATTTPSIDGTVHFEPRLITDPQSLGENGRTIHLQPLHWLIQQTHTW